MCHNVKIIASVKNGELSYCENCKMYSLMYNNLLFQFDKTQLLHFRAYVSKIDIEYWLSTYSCTTKKRKIHMNTMHQNLVLMFNLEEIEDLKVLLTLKDTNQSEKITASDIDYPLILN